MKDPEICIYDEKYLPEDRIKLLKASLADIKTEIKELSSEIDGIREEISKIKDELAGIKTTLCGDDGDHDHSELP